MKRNRITSALLAFFLVFSLIGMFAQPAYALKASEVDITLYNLTKWYDNDSGNYYVKFILNNENLRTASISFKKSTLYTLDDGRIVPRINISCQNIKGQSLKMYIYDEDGELIREIQGKKSESNDETGCFTWTGKAGNQQYPDGEYTVKIVSSGGLSIKKKFYLDFPYNN